MASLSSHMDRTLAGRKAPQSMSCKTTTTRLQTDRSGSRTAATSSGFRDNEMICAVSEGRGIAPTIGLAFVNLTTAEAVICQFADTQTYARACHKIKVFGPSEVILSETAEKSKMASILTENLEEERGDPPLAYINRRYWNESIGHDYLRQLAFPDDYESLKLSLVGRYFGLCCFAAALRYIDLGIGKMFAPQTLRIKFEPSEGAMMIDTSTVTSLELVQNLQSAKSKDCLFGLLDRTLTRMGTRILRSNILQPSTDRTKIQKRHEAVQELSTKEAMFFAVREALEGIVDTDKALAALIVVEHKIDFAYMESSINNVLMLKSFVDSIVPVFQALTGAQSEELLEIREICNLEHYINVQELVKYALNEDCKFSTQSADLHNQRVYAIQTGVNGFLDVARRTYQEISTDIREMSNDLMDQHQINFQLKFEPARHFFFRIKAIEIEDGGLPEIFTNVFRSKGWIECQTLELLKMNQRLRDAHAEVISLSDSSVQKLIDEVRMHIHPLFKVSEGIALLDMLASFAHTVTTQNYVRPELLETTLGIKSGRHPIREVLQRDKFVPNDVYATPQTRFQIITGCNMSGKSTYIRSVALMTIMTQIGCFVPAEYGGFSMMHQVFARVSTDDNIEANVSTFASEMREMAFILRNVEPQSLVIVDELGRGTSTTDGLTIAIAISEALIESKAYVFFVTHFRDLSRILAERAGVVSLHLAVDIAPDFSKMKMMYRIAPGCEEQKYYGLAIAKLMDLPEQVTSVAAEVSQYLNERNEARKSSAKTLAVAKKRKLVLSLKEHLMQAHESEMGNERLRPHLKKLQEEFLIRMSAIEAEVAAAGLTDIRAEFRPLGQGTGNHVEDPIDISTACTSPSSTSRSSSVIDEGSGSTFCIPGRVGPTKSSSVVEMSDDMIMDDREDVIYRTGDSPQPT